MRLKTGLFLGLLLLLQAAACSLVPGALDDEDISRYIKAYENIAKVSKQLEEQKKQSDSISVFTCKSCYATLEQAVVDAGYRDLKSFLITDARIHMAMHYMAYLEISRITAEIADEFTPEEFCESARLISDSKDPQEAAEQCRRIRIYTGYLKKAGSLVYETAGKLMHKGDFAVIKRHLQAIHAALTNPELISEFNHTHGSGFDD